MSETSTPPPPPSDAVDNRADGTAASHDDTPVGSAAGTADAADEGSADGTPDGAVEGGADGASEAGAQAAAEAGAEAAPQEAAESIDGSAAVPSTATSPGTASTDKPASTDNPARPDTPRLSPEASALELKRRFPALFSGAPKPVKLRVHVDIHARAPGVFTKPALTAFFRRHMGSTAYLIALTKASHRYDLDGQPVEELSNEHREAAHQELNRRRDLRQSRQAQEEDERRNRATLLRDYENTTLTPANFGALKGLTPEVLEEILTVARQEASEAPRPPHPQDRRGPPPGRREGFRDGPRVGPQGAPRGGPRAGGLPEGRRDATRAGPGDGPNGSPNGGPNGGRRDDGPRNPPRIRR